MKNYSFEDVLKLILVIVSLVFILLSINNFSLYRINNGFLEEYSKKEVRKSEILLPEVIKTLEIDGEDIIVKLVVSEQVPNKFNIVVFNKSMFSEKYNLIKSYLNLEFGDKYEIELSSPKKDLLLELDTIDKAKIDYRILRRDRTLVKRVMISTLLVFTFNMLMSFILKKFRKKENIYG